MLGHWIPIRVYFGAMIIMIFFVGGSRMGFRILRSKKHMLSPGKSEEHRPRTLIVGAGETGSHAIGRMMDTAPDKLAIGGRLCVISFHSLEDRIVKLGIQRRENGCTCPREAPICTCGFVKTLKSVSRKPILPSAEEIEKNPRSRSAKLRVAERV
jgi:hypothetical protein